MKTLLLSCVLAACAPHTAKVPADPPAPLATPAAAPIQAAPPAAPALDEAAVKAKSHDFFDAIDRADVAAFGDMVGPTFVFFERARFLDAALLTKSMQARNEHHAPIRSREWRDERVKVGGNAAVFIGRAVEHSPADGDRPAVELDGYNTLVWVHEPGGWKVAHGQWERAGLAAERDHWNEVFHEHDVPFNLKPNQLLVDTVKGKKPGTALDLLCGQGRNALYLASQGWKVTGVDISDEGLKQAREAAAKQKLRLDTVEADVDAFDLGKDRWDLVTMIYAGNNAKLVERIKPSLKKGGLFVTEYFHADTDVAKTGAGGWATGELAKLFGDGGFEILRDDVVEDVADWGLRKQKLVRFVARKK